MKFTAIHRLILILAACFFMGAFCQASMETLPSSSQNGPVLNPGSLDDLLDKVPFINWIPKSFMVGDGYHVTLDGERLQINHMGSNSYAPMSRRACMVCLTYQTPIAFFSSRVDVPLFNSSNLFSSWSHSTMGDYVLNLSQDQITHPGLRLTVSARF